MNPAVKGLLVVIVISGALLAGWLKYSDFLARGQKPPMASQILNDMEKNGVPDFELEDITGKNIALKDYRGKVVLLNFWASWCEPCIQEFPSMIKLIEEMKGDVILLAVSADYERADIDPFLKAFKVKSEHIKIMWDKDQNVAKQYGTFKLPESYLIGKNGELVRKVAGIEDWATPEAFEYFQMLIEGKTQPE